MRFSKEALIIKGKCLQFIGSERKVRILFLSALMNPGAAAAFYASVHSGGEKICVIFAGVVQFFAWLNFIMYRI